MLCSAPGHDVSGRVEAMARQEKKDLTAVAMGSVEGFSTAEKLVTAASKRGTWVMLKNCHLCTEWLQDVLVKKLQSLGTGTHSDFRIFLTSEINPKLPTALLRLSDIIIAEAPTGVKASLSRFFSNIPNDRLENPVANRLYLALGWIHAVVQERLRYVPAGWTQNYAFTEADAVHALDVIDALLEDSAGGRKNVDPEKVRLDQMPLSKFRIFHFIKLIFQICNGLLLFSIIQILVTVGCVAINSMQEYFWRTHYYRY